jgi:hypothetical protein
MAYERIKSGQAKRILAGSTSDSGPIFGVVDAMKVCTLNIMNHQNKVQDQCQQALPRTRQWSWRNGFRRL